MELKWIKQLEKNNKNMEKIKKTIWKTREVQHIRRCIWREICLGLDIGCIAEGVGCIMCFHRPKALGPRAEVRPIEEDRVQHILIIFSLLKWHLRCAKIRHRWRRRLKPHSMNIVLFISSSPFQIQPQFSSISTQSFNSSQNLMNPSLLKIKIKRNHRGIKASHIRAFIP